MIRHAVALAFVACTVALPARADPTVDECIAANTSAQTQRRDGKLREARAQLLLCAAASCPKMVRDDCTKRMDEVDRAMPTIVFQAKDSHGGDLVNVDVTMDGSSLTSTLDGHALTVDVGDHQFTFSAQGYNPVTQHFVLVEGQKDRRETITLTSTAPLVVAPPPTPPPPLVVEPPPPVTRTVLGPPPVAPTPSYSPFVDTSAVEARRSRRSTGVTLTVLSVISFGGAAAFAALGAAQNGKITGGGFATSDDIASADSAGQAFNIALGVCLVGGGLLAAVGLPLWLLNLGDGTPSKVALRW